MATKRDFDGKRKPPEAPGGTTESGECDFARFSQQTCRGEIVELKSLSSTKQKAAIPEKTLILARCGFFKGAPHLKDICSFHVTQLGFNFKDKKKNCGYKADDGKGCSRKGMKPINFEESKFLKEQNKFLPPGKNICITCYMSMKKAKENMSECSQESSATEEPSSSVKASQEEFQFEGSQSNLCPRETLNQLFKASNMDQEVSHTLRKDWNDISKSVKSKVKSAAAQGIVAVLKSIASHDFQTLWKEIKNSDIVENILGMNNSDETVQTILEAYNASDSSQERVMALSVIANKHSYSSVRYLNWQPALTRFRWNKAFIHCKTKGPMKVIQPCKIPRHKLDHTILHLIVDFLKDSSVMNDTAYGTTSIEVEGVKHKICKVIRSQSNSVLVQQVKSYIIENGFKPPSDSYIFTLLAACKASRSNILTGLDNIKEDCRRAFAELGLLIESVGKKANDFEWTRKLQEMRKSAETYLKCKYSQEIEFESDCASHCIQCSLSDPTEKKICSRAGT